MSSRTEKIKEMMGKNNNKRKKSVKVVFILDESGSMQTCKEQTIKGFNEYLDALKKEKDVSFKVTLTKFGGNRTETVYTNQPVATAPKLTDDNYRPNNDTPLYDAIGRTINADKSEKKTLFVIMTDGEENASVEYKKDAIISLIKQQEKIGWTFIYLGANQDAWANSQQLGIVRGNTLSFDSINTKKIYGDLALATSNFALAPSIQTKNFFNQKQKKKDMFYVRK